MLKKLNSIFYRLFVFVLIINIISIDTHLALASDLNSDSLNFIKKVSKSYTNKFCNSIGFGLSKESAMKFSIEENKKVFKNKKEMNNVNKELLAEEIAIAVVEKCGYPINLSGEKGIQEFKDYYISKDKTEEKYN